MHRNVLADHCWRLAGATSALVPALWLTTRAESSVFFASIAGSTIFVFALTEAPAAQPRAVLGGHLLSAALGVACLDALGPGLPTMVVAVMLTMIGMLATRTVHPPAGANALLVVNAGAGWHVLLMPIVPCLAVVIAVACVWSRLRRGPRYPFDVRARSPV